MEKVSESGSGEQFTGESDEAPLSNPNPESVNRFDAILLDSKKAGKKEHGSSNGGTGDVPFGQKRDDFEDVNNGAPKRSEAYGTGDVPLSQKRDDFGDVSGGAPRGNRIHGEEEKNEERRKIDKRNYRKITKNVQFGGDAILGSLHTSSEFHKAEAAKAEKQVNIIKSVGTEIAERILASTAALNAKQEVRITLKNSVLPSTEIILAKDGKMLSVDFFTSASASASLLSSKQAELRLHLLNTLHDVNDVDVNVYQDTSAESGDSHDGRSRDEYVGDYDSDGDEQK
ncbi:MAG: hypothetical protein LBD33_03630 [Puniceicoccales bacterium]|jgi:hypothetical protein|nr:hypothetical protein [Puniceicoccales bacterium]